MRYNFIIVVDFISNFEVRQFKGEVLCFRSGTEYGKDDKDWMVLGHFNLFWITSHYSDHWSWLSYWPQLGILYLLAWLRPRATNFMEWCHVLVWPPRNFLQLASTRTNIVGWSKRYLGMGNTCTNHSRRSKFTTASTDITPLSNTFGVSSILLTRSFWILIKFSFNSYLNIDLRLKKLLCTVLVTLLLKTTKYLCYLKLIDFLYYLVFNPK